MASVFGEMTEKMAFRPTRHHYKICLRIGLIIFVFFGAIGLWNGYHDARAKYELDHWGSYQVQIVGDITDEHKELVHYFKTGFFTSFEHVKFCSPESVEERTRQIYVSASGLKKFYEQISNGCLQRYESYRLYDMSMIVAYNSLVLPFIYATAPLVLLVTLMAVISLFLRLTHWGGIVFRWVLKE